MGSGILVGSRPFCCLLLLLLLLLPLAMHGEARMHAVAPVDTWCPQCLCTMSYVVTTATTDQTASEQLGLCTAVLFWSVGARRGGAAGRGSAGAAAAREAMRQGEKRY